MMNLYLFATSTRGRKAYKDEAGTLILNILSCKTCWNKWGKNTDKKGYG